MKTLEIDDAFQTYVEPKVHNRLTSFCTELTGITQSMIENQPCLELTLKSFDQWMHKNKDLILDPERKNFTFLTCGDWDLKLMLPKQCNHFKIEIPWYFREWINIKKSFAEHTGTFPRGMMAMLNALNVEHQGRHHSGIDDCSNIANIAKKLAQMGYIFE